MSDYSRYADANVKANAPHEPYHDPLVDRMMQAPGLTLNMVDKLVRDAWAQGYEAGSTAERLMWLPEINTARMKLEAHRKQVEDVIRGQLNHIAGRMRDRSVWKKRTIQHERDFIEEQYDQLDRAIIALESNG